MKKAFCLSIAILTSFSSMSWAIPTSITYQGSLKKTGATVPSNVKMSFHITNSDGTQVYWSSGERIVPVGGNGLFSTQLSPTGVDWQNVVPYMEVTVENQVLLPREPITTTVYAAMSQSVVDGAITNAKLANSVGIVPTGAISAYAGPSAPSGWLICDGAAISRTTYNNLFSAIGTNWGGGDGSATFNLPDLRGRNPLGAGSGPGLTNRTLGSTLGQETHQLTVSEIPSGLTVTDPGHFHTSNVLGGESGFTNGQSARQATNGGSGGVFSPAYGTYPATTGISVGGGNSAHSIMQPSAIVNFIIKT